MLILLMRSRPLEVVLLDNCSGLLVGGFVKEMVFLSTLPLNLFFLLYDYIITLHFLPRPLLARWSLLSIKFIGSDREWGWSY